MYNTCIYIAVCACVNKDTRTIQYSQTRSLSPPLSPWCHQVKSLGEDLQDGLLLVELLNRLAVPKAIEKWDKKPRGKLQSIGNLGIALNFCAMQNIKLVNIGKPIPLYIYYI